MFLKLDKKFIDLGHEKLAYVTYGSGKEILVLVHGNFSSSYHFEPIIKLLGDDYTIYAPDVRGFGDSSYNNRFDSLEELADDIIKFIERLHLGNVYLAGWSAGGAIAQVVACERPDLVKKLVLIAPGSPKGYPVFKKGPKNEILLGQIYTSKEELATDPVQVAPMLGILQTQNAAAMRYIWDLAIYSSGNKPDEESSTYFIAESLKQKNLVDLDWALCKFNITHEVGFYGPGTGLIDQLKVPTLILWGNKDLTINKYMLDETVRLFGRHATTQVYDGCGHSPIVDRPQQVVADMKAFLDKK